MSIFSNVPVFRFFEEISSIPRCSGNEKAISDYLVEFARLRNLEVIQDKALNVIIKKPGTPGYENAPAVIIQGHMDMVCDKNRDTVHDFSKDPLKLRVEGDMLYATGTTLGADNGIAVAYGLALLDSKDIPHPPVEVLITTDEESGMSGAEALNPDDLKGRYLINIDAEEEGVFFVSCAGGLRTEHSVKADWSTVGNGLIPLLISIRGLKGGHSGADIHLGRGNSNKLIGRLLNGLMQEVEFYLADIKGGARPNVIPREAEALILINAADENRLKDKVKDWEGTFKKEFRSSDPDVSILVEKQDKEVKRVLSQDTMKKVIASLVLIPNGVQTMSMEIKGLVESSTNLGEIETSDNNIAFRSAIRSSVKSQKYNIMNHARIAAEAIGAEFTPSAEYPEWEYNPSSVIRDIFARVYEEKYGKKPEIVAIHAGLECGLFNEKMPHLDMISCGPNLYDVHSPNEHVSISSVNRTWEFLQDVLKEIR